jgi:hypothetical protein
VSNYETPPLIIRNWPSWFGEFISGYGTQLIDSYQWYDALSIKNWRPNSDGFTGSDMSLWFSCVTVYVLIQKGRNWNQILDVQHINYVLFHLIMNVSLWFVTHINEAISFKLVLNAINPYLFTKGGNSIWMF